MPASSDNPSTLNRFRFLLLCYLLGFAALISLSAASMAEVRFERLWPQLLQPWYFNEPRAVATAFDGSLYVADTGNHRIQVFAADGAFVRQWGSFGTDPGQFSRPAGIATSPDGTIYVVDTGNHRIQAFTPEGVFLRQWGTQGDDNGEFDQPHGIAVTSDRRVVIADSNNHRIQVFSATGDFLRQWGNNGQEEGFFNEPYDLSVSPDGSLFVVERGNHRIQVFDTNGTFLRIFGAMDQRDGEFRNPAGIAIASDGTIYVADTGNYRIQAFTADGAFIRKWGRGSIGVGNGEFSDPYGIAVAPDGKIYVADSANQLIQTFTGEGVFVRQYGSFGTKAGEFYDPSAIAIAPNGMIYVADSGNHRIQTFNSEGLFDQQFGSFGFADGEFYYPAAVAVAPDGTVYVAERDNHRIQIFSAEHVFLSQFGSFGIEEGEFDQPSGLAVAPDGTVYVVDRKNFRVQAFNPQGQFLRQFGGFGSDPGQFGDPYGIAVAPNGTVYVTDSGTARIQVFTALGEFISEFGNIGANEGQLVEPFGIRISSDGIVYVTDFSNHRVLAYHSDGVFLGRFGSFGSGEGQFNAPTDIAITGNGTLYVLEKLNHRVQKLRLVDSHPLPGSQVLHSYKAVILAGGGPSRGSYTNLIWDATQLLTNRAFFALRRQGFAKDEIKFLSPVTQSDLDNNGLFDDYEDATLDSLQQAITDWASDAEQVTIYLADHGGPGRFQVNDREILTAESLRDWVNQLEAQIPGPVTLILEACKSGSFFPALLGSERFLVSSADAEQPAVIGNKGLNAFSYYFWSEIGLGADLKSAFKTARQGMASQQIEGRPQNAQLDSDGDGRLTGVDENLAEGHCLGNCTQTAANPPSILTVTPATQLNGTMQLELSMEVNSLEPVLSAWAILQRPDFAHPDSDEPVSDLVEVPLLCDASNRCQGLYDRFDVAGEYLLTFYAQDQSYQLSLPATSVITQTQGATSCAISPCPAPNAIVFDPALAANHLIVPDVREEGSSYRYVFDYLGDIRFRIKQRQILPAPVSTEPAIYDGVLTLRMDLPRVYFAGSYYRATLVNRGEGLFEVDLESIALLE